MKVAQSNIELAEETLDQSPRPFFRPVFDTVESGAITGKRWLARHERYISSLYTTISQKNLPAGLLGSLKRASRRLLQRT